MPLAKLTQPRSINPISRQRLFRLLDQAGKKPVTWVWAPPGAGKTTLVASYLSTKKLRTLWFQVDAGDNDLATFFYYLGLAALKRNRPMALFTPEYQLGLPIFTRNFFRELFSRLKPPFALIFDNYQEIESTSALHDAVQGALSEIPDGGRVIFISRSEPPAPFAILRAKQSVEILDGYDLRFIRTEVHELAKRLAPGRWPNAVINELYETSDGWAAGLVLLLEQRRKDGQTTVGTIGNKSQVLFDYFAGEIFKGMDEATQQVLLQTSFLPTITETMAQELAGMEAAGQILGKLHRENYFTNRRAGEETSYEYHPLFREFLLAEAKRTYSQAQLNDVRRRAADTAKASGLIEAAAELYREIEDWERLTALVCETAPVFLGQGRMTVIEQWIAAIPTPTLNENPWLLYWQGTLASGWKHAFSQQRLEAAFSRFEGQQNIIGMLLSSAGLIMAMQGAGISKPMDRWIDSIERLLPQLNEPLPLAVDTLVSSAMLSGIAVRRVDHPEALYWAQRAMHLARQQDNLAFLGFNALNWVIYFTNAGHMQQAAAVIDDLIALQQNPNSSPVVVVNAAMGLVWYEWFTCTGDYRRTIAQALTIASRSGMFYAARSALLGFGVFGALSDGDADLAENWRTDLGKDARTMGPGFNCYYEAANVRLRLLRGDLEGAFINHPTMLTLGLEAGFPPVEAMARLISAIVLNTRRVTDTVSEHIELSIDIARKMKSPYVEFMARTTEAHIYLDNGKETQGLESLHIAMELGRKGGFVNSFVWQPNIMARLAAKALEHGIEVDYARMLIKKRNLVPDEPPIDIEAWPWPVRIYTLGHFVILKDDQPLHFSGKVQRKPLALLKTIIAFGGKDVREDTLLDTLWPDADGDAARFALTSAIHRLRKLLGQEQAIVRQDNEISLDNRYCWIDIWAVERMLERSDTLLSGNGDERQWPQAIELLDKAIKLYQGPFLNNDPDIPSSSISDRIQRRLLRQLAHLGQHWERKDDFEKAAALYEQGFDIDPCAEDICRKLMTTYHKLGRPAEAVSTYNVLKKALNERLGIQPSAETEGLKKRLAGLV